MGERGPNACNASDLRSIEVRAVRDDRAAAIAVPPEASMLF